MSARPDNFKHESPTYHAAADNELRLIMTKKRGVRASRSDYVSACDTRARKLCRQMLRQKQAR